MKSLLGTVAMTVAIMAGAGANAFECKRSDASFDKPGGFLSSVNNDCPLWTC